MPKSPPSSPSPSCAGQIFSLVDCPALSSAVSVWLSQAWGGSAHDGGQADGEGFGKHWSSVGSFRCWHTSDCRCCTCCRGVAGRGCRCTERSSLAGTRDKSPLRLCPLEVAPSYSWTYPGRQRKLSQEIYQTFNGDIHGQTHNIEDAMLIDCTHYLLTMLLGFLCGNFFEESESTL